MWIKVILKGLLTSLIIFIPSILHAQSCDRACLEDIAEQYRLAYLQHNPSAVSISDNVRFTENNVEMPFPDASWDTVTEVVGPVQVLSDAKTGNVAMYMALMQRDTESYLAVRLKVLGREITEIEHMLSTKRNLSGPPTPIAEVAQNFHDPVIDEIIPFNERISRERLAAHADGYFSTLELNDGEIRGTRFSPDATRRENGWLFSDIESGFKLGYYAFNNKVRREIVLIDEERGVAMSRAFIDHKGVMDSYVLTDGTIKSNIYREPHSWALLEMFKIKDDRIVAVIATFIGAPYNMRTPWSENLNP